MKFIILIFSIMILLLSSCESMPTGSDQFSTNGQSFTSKEKLSQISEEAIKNCLLIQSDPQAKHDDIIKKCNLARQILSVKDLKVELENFPPSIQEKFNDLDFNKALDEILSGVYCNETDSTQGSNNRFEPKAYPTLRSAARTSPFGYRIHPIKKKKIFHEGVDLDVNMKKPPIYAVDDGEVIFSGKQTGYGNIVIIKHSDSTITKYAHNASNLVKKGQKIKAGDQIAIMGNTGGSTGVHLHFEIVINGKPVDPWPYLKKVP